MYETKEELIKKLKEAYPVCEELHRMKMSYIELKNKAEYLESDFSEDNMLKNYIRIYYSMASVFLFFLCFGLTDIFHKTFPPIYLIDILLIALAIVLPRIYIKIQRNKKQNFLNVAIQARDEQYEKIQKYIDDYRYKYSFIPEDYILPFHIKIMTGILEYGRADNLDDAILLMKTHYNEYYKIYCGNTKF